MTRTLWFKKVWKSKCAFYDSRHYCIVGKYSKSAFMGVSPLNKSNRKDKAVSPAISTVILASTIIATMVVALAYANNLLSSKTAESDFNSAKQFMQTVGLQVDDVAWTIGRTETVRYSTKYGQMELLPKALRYTIHYQNESEGPYYPLASHEVGVLLFNIPISQYSVSDDYYEEIFPSSSSFILTGASAPVVRVFAVECLGSGSSIRVVVAPCIRILNSKIGTAESEVFYTKLYLPVLLEGGAPRLGHSVTLRGDAIDIRTVNKVTGFKVEVDFTRQDDGFDNSFFHFPASLCYEETITDGYDDSMVELYASNVTVSLGAHA